MYRRISLVFALISGLALSPGAFASGFALGEQGAKAVALGGAFAATADDPTAIFFNVAGLAYQHETEMNAGLTLITFNAQFEGSNDDYPGPDEIAFYEDHTFAPVNAYFVMPINETMTFGLGQFTAYGLRTDWEDPETFAGRFISKDAELKTASVQPSFAMQLADGKFAWGAGIEYRAAHVKLARNLAGADPFSQLIADIGQVRYDSGWDGDFGWNIGLMYRPSDEWSFGASYRSDMTIEFDGDAEFKQFPTGNAQFDAIVASRLPPDQGGALALDFPSTTYLGAAWQMNPTWRFETNLTYTTWSVLEELVIDFENASTPDLNAPQHWDDTMSYRFGTTVQATDRWQVRMGIYYDENPQPTEAVGPILPDADRWGPSFGIGFQGEKFSLDITELFLVFADRNTEGVNHDNFNGEYQTTANLFSVNLGYKF